MIVILNCIWVMLMALVYFPEHDDRDHGSPIYWYYCSLVTLLLALAPIVHWIFAIKYFESAIDAPLLIQRDSVEFKDLQRRQKRNKWVIRGLNISVSLAYLLAAIISFAFNDDDDYYRSAFEKFWNFEAWSLAPRLDL